MVTVRDAEDRSLSVMAYIMNERFREPMLPSGFYYKGILLGYRQNGLPVPELKKAWEHAVEEVHAATERINASFSAPAKTPRGRNRHER